MIHSDGRLQEIKDETKRVIDGDRPHLPKVSNAPLYGNYTGPTIYDIRDLVDDLISMRRDYYSERIGE